MSTSSPATASDRGLDGEHLAAVRGVREAETLAHPTPAGQLGLEPVRLAQIAAQVARPDGDGKGQRLLEVLAGDLAVDAPQTVRVRERRASRV